MYKSRWYFGLIAVVGWFALVLQFSLSIPKFIATGRTLVGSIIQVISYFTILTNLLVAISMSVLFIKSQSPLGTFFSNPATATLITIYITVVGLVYNLVLRQLWKPDGLDQIADELLHSVIPLLCVLYWLIFVSKGSLRFKAIISGLLYPFLYSAYVLIRGAMTDLYPYPFMDVKQHGYGTVLLNMLIIVMLFLLTGLFFLWMDVKMGKSSASRLPGKQA